MAHEKVIIVDFGGRHNQLIARRVRDCGVYCEVVSCKKTAEEIAARKPIGIILIGGPKSVSADNAPALDPAVLELGVPVLGIGYGCRIMEKVLGGKLRADAEEYTSVPAEFDSSSVLFRHAAPKGNVWMSLGDTSSALPAGFRAVAHTADCKDAAIENTEKNFYGFRFHPESDATENGFDMVRSFLFDVCHVSGDWSMKDYLQDAITELREKIGDGKVLLALSGGVDSSVCAALLERAVGKQLTCVFVDHGLMRKNEGDEVEAAFAEKQSKFIRVNAQDRFLGKLKGVTDPERKRKIIGEEFIRVFEEESKKIGKVDFLAQGTIYPDIIESGSGDGTVIKSHHNVGGLPDYVDFKEIIEPLRLLFKDEVRQLGRELNLPEVLVTRQPFPGPGLGVRVIGEITFEKLEILRDADYIFRDELAKAGEASKISQYFAILTGMRSVGVRHEKRTYEYTLALRAVNTTDFMTAQWVRIPYDVLDRASARIVKEVPGINRVVYDITSKPPATIEWE